MTRLISILGVTCFLSAIGLATFSANRTETLEAVATLDLEVLPGKFDLGTLDQHSEVPAKFKLRNLTSSQLKIVHVSKTCSCAEPVLGANELNPGTFTTLDVRFKSQMRSGTFEVPLQIHYTSPESPDTLKVLTIRLAGTVRPAIELSSPSFEFFPDSKFAFVTMTPGSQPLPRIIAVTPSTKSVRAKLVGFTIQVERSDGKESVDGEYVLVETDQPMTQWLRIPLRNREAKPATPGDANPF